MNEMQQAAYIMAMAACAQVEAIGFQNQNTLDLANGRPPTYSMTDFETLIQKYGIHHDAVITFFHRS